MRIYTRTGSYDHGVRDRREIRFHRYSGKFAAEFVAEDAPASILVTVELLPDEATELLDKLIDAGVKPSPKGEDAVTKAAALAKQLVEVLES